MPKSEFGMPGHFVIRHLPPPADARCARQPTIGKTVDDAMNAENSSPPLQSERGLSALAFGSPQA